MPVVMNTPPPSVFSKLRDAPLVWGTVAGIALGATYALSPVSVWLLIAIAGLLVWVGCSLTGRERRWVMGILTIGVVLRVLMIALLFLGSEAADCGWATRTPSGTGDLQLSAWMNVQIGQQSPMEAPEKQPYPLWDRYSDYVWPSCSSLTVGTDHYVNFFWDGDGRALKRRDGRRRLRRPRRERHRPRPDEHRRHRLLGRERQPGLEYALHPQLLVNRCFDPL